MASEHEDMARIFRGLVDCTDRSGTHYEVSVFDHFSHEVGREFIGQAASLPDGSAVMVLAEGQYKVIWSREELRSVEKFGADWGEKKSST